MQSDSVKFQEQITRAYYRQFFTLHEGLVYVFALVGQKVLNFRPLPFTPEVRIVEKLIIKSSAELITADLLAAKIGLQAANARYREFEREVRQLADEQDRGRDAVIAAELKREMLVKQAYDRLEV
ncbi:hypothetical protein Rhal01_01071 [Rubritalea halochordaticola]|uniref:Uncharacterized protein n=2 Tax=Rubritalea halochordaticola TaxID=714537 RepID=A0ABP9UWR5_9BACT